MAPPIRLGIHDQRPLCTSKNGASREGLFNPLNAKAVQKNWSEKHARNKRATTGRKTYSSHDVMSRGSIILQQFDMPVFLDQSPSRQKKSNWPAMACGQLLGLLAFAAVAIFAAMQNAASAADEPAPIAGASTEYSRALAEYNSAQRQYEAMAAAYWTSIADQRKLRIAKRGNGQDVGIDDYVLTQPPVYAGPAKPKDPAVAQEERSPAIPKPIPTVTDFLSNALSEFQFMPWQPSSETEFKTAYAEVAAEAGLTRAQIVRVYAFESGGNGKYNVQAGLEYDRPNAHAISTALGYNQLLNTNSVELMAEKGDKFLSLLRKKALSLDGSARAKLEDKIVVVRKMVDFSRSVPDEWSQHESLAMLPKGLGVHAMNLDLDVGPLLQTQKLLDSVLFARSKGLERELSAAELEMMNLTGDGNGFDMISLPMEMRDKVPTSNFFQRGGYERNPVAIRNNTVAKLLFITDAKMDTESKLYGALELASAYETSISHLSRAK
jgi:hypothetical protein